MIKNGEGAGIRYTLIVAVLIFTSMEIATWLVFRVLKSRFTFEDPAQYLVSDDELDRIIYGYDAALGWKTVYATSHGERPRRRQYDTTQILTFGDSFTHGDEVADGETWQEHLAERLRSNVFNFGNGAYGTDQAYLRFSETPEIKTKYILLGLITENINRTVNVYRKFYKPNTGFPLTKPRYILEGNRIDLLENPVRSISELPKLQDAYFIRRIGQYDYWYKRNRFPSFSFPYSKLVFNSQIWREAIYGKVGDEIDITSKSNPRALWQETEPTRIMFYLFDRFVADVTSLGATPVIVIFPLRYQIKNKIRRNSIDFPIEKILNYCALKKYICFSPIGPMSAQVKYHGEKKFFMPGGHYSAFGNQVVSKLLNQFLIDLERNSREEPKSKKRRMGNG